MDSFLSTGVAMMPPEGFLTTSLRVSHTRSRDYKPGALKSRTVAATTYLRPAPPPAQERARYCLEFRRGMQDITREFRPARRRQSSSGFASIRRRNHDVQRRARHKITQPTYG